MVPSEDLNLRLWANGSKDLSFPDSFSVPCGVLTIHILFAIGALYRHRNVGLLEHEKAYTMNI